MQSIKVKYQHIILCGHSTMFTCVSILNKKVSVAIISYVKWEDILVQ